MLAINFNDNTVLIIFMIIHSSCLLILCMCWQKWLHTVAGVAILVGVALVISWWSNETCRRTSHLVQDDRLTELIKFKFILHIELVLVSSLLVSLLLLLLLLLAPPPPPPPPPPLMLLSSGLASFGLGGRVGLNSGWEGEGVVLRIGLYTAFGVSNGGN